MSVPRRRRRRMPESARAFFAFGEKLRRQIEAERMQRGHSQREG